MKLTYLLAAIILLSSCATQKSTQWVKVKKNTPLSRVEYKDSSNPALGYKIEIRQLTEKTVAVLKIDDASNKVSLQFPKGTTTSLKKSVDLSGGAIAKAKPNKSDEYEIPYRFANNTVVHEMLQSGSLASDDIKGFDNTKNALCSNQFFSYRAKKAFRYSTFSKNLQAVTIPFKYRPAVDTIPYKLTTSANVGASYTLKWTTKWYRPLLAEQASGSAPVAYENTLLEFNLAPFFGFNAIELNSKNTGEKVVTDTKVLGMNYGLILSVGVGSVDLGVAGGIDSGIGDQAKNWIYQGRHWFGLVVGLDVVK